MTLLGRQLRARIQHDLDPAVLGLGPADRAVLAERDRREPRGIDLGVVLQVVHDGERARRRQLPVGDEREHGVVGLGFGVGLRVVLGVGLRVVLGTLGVGLGLLLLSVLGRLGLGGLGRRRLGLAQVDRLIV